MPPPVSSPVPVGLRPISITCIQVPVPAIPADATRLTMQYRFCNVDDPEGQTFYDSNSQSADHVTIGDGIQGGNPVDLGPVQVWTTSYNDSGSTQSDVANSAFIQPVDSFLFLGMDPLQTTLYVLFLLPSWNGLLPYTSGGTYHPASPAIQTWQVNCNGDWFQGGTDVAGCFLFSIPVAAVTLPPYNVQWNITDSRGNYIFCVVVFDPELAFVTSIPGFCPTCPVAPGG